MSKTQKKNEVRERPKVRAQCPRGLGHEVSERFKRHRVRGFVMLQYTCKACGRKSAWLRLFTTEKFQKACCWEIPERSESDV